MIQFRYLAAFVLFCTTSCLSAGDFVGWRNDGTGRFPNATPPTKWSSEENILWKTPLPGKGYASPIVVGERLFVVSEPADVICINASDGKVIWQVSLSMSDVIGKEEAAKINESYQELTRQEKVLRKSFKQLEETDPNREKIKQQSAAIKLKINAMKASYPIGRGSSTNACGTPLCDGERLFVTMGTGIVAALTLDGKIIWNRFVEGSRLGFGHSNSGVLADGKLIVQYKDLIALDPATGKELWRSQSVNPRYATPVVTEIDRKSVV
jgi:glucose dehydrogenase